jgi:predicted branched-subunit amino acid permease
MPRPSPIQLQYFWRGVLETPSIPAVVLTLTFIGFGALARDSGLDMLQAVFTTVSVWALPGQVVMLDQIRQGMGIAGVFFAVTLTAVRLMPLTISLLPHLRNNNTPKWLQLIMAHYIAVTVWVESMRRLPKLPKEQRIPYYLGFASTLFLINALATALGFYLAASLPVSIAAALIFMTPVYFFLAMIDAAKERIDYFALSLGMVMGPLFYVMFPGLDLMLTGLLAGTVAYLASRT